MIGTVGRDQQSPSSPVELASLRRHITSDRFQLRFRVLEFFHHVLHTLFQLWYSGSVSFYILIQLVSSPPAQTYRNRTVGRIHRCFSPLRADRVFFTDM